MTTPRRSIPNVCADVPEEFLALRLGEALRPYVDPRWPEVAEELAVLDKDRKRQTDGRGRA